MISVHSKVSRQRMDALDLLWQQGIPSSVMDVAYKRHLSVQLQQKIYAKTAHLNCNGWPNGIKLRVGLFAREIEAYQIARVPMSSPLHGRVMFVSNEDMSRAYIGRDARLYLRRRGMVIPEVYRPVDLDDVHIRHIEFMNVMIDEV